MKPRSMSEGEKKRSSSPADTSPRYTGFGRPPWKRSKSADPPLKRLKQLRREGNLRSETSPFEFARTDNQDSQATLPRNIEMMRPFASLEGRTDLDIPDGSAKITNLYKIFRQNYASITEEIQKNSFQKK